MPTKKPLSYPQDNPPDPPEGVTRWLICADESGIDGASHFGFGTLWMRWQRRGEFAEAMTDIRRRHRYRDECKWEHVRRYSLDFYTEMVDYFFSRSWLAFHCMIVKRSDIEMAHHDGDIDLARRKFFGLLVSNKVKKSIRKFRGREQTYRLWVDPIASRYERADEALEVIANRQVAKSVHEEIGEQLIEKVLTHDSKTTPHIQLCDLLLGAVVDAWNERSTARHKRAIQDAMANHMGWRDLKSDTMPTMSKFNVWYFQDPRQRRVKTRSSKLL